MTITPSVRPPGRPPRLPRQSGTTEIHLKMFLASVGFLTFIALLVATVILAKAGQPMWAAFTGSGAVCVCLGLFFKLLLTLGRSS
ncbi:hypothetical protein [Deinococcus sp. 6GRE01]|uniref:hypothetical protein n=1 Tax=Deinococcus sp. 6GRE01 TaxID=2745873 RepID=UPI001E6217D1|nr:hypothetical protein [Deinococcus sp. 6GRE01]MCD0156997.1 hypothetical protein [Deinococcus sp. 6GRE01]